MTHQWTWKAELRRHCHWLCFWQHLQPVWAPLFLGHHQQLQIQHPSLGPHCKIITHYKTGAHDYLQQQRHTRDTAPQSSKCIYDVDTKYTDADLQKAKNNTAHNKFCWYFKTQSILQVLNTNDPSSQEKGFFYKKCYIISTSRAENGVQNFGAQCCS